MAALRLVHRQNHLARRRLRRERVFRYADHPFDVYDDVDLFDMYRFRRHDIMDLVDLVDDNIEISNRMGFSVGRW